MANFFAQYPASAAGTSPSTGINGQPAPASSTEVAGVNPSGNLQPISVDASGNQNVNVVSSALPAGAATSANQSTANTSLSAIQTSAADIDSKTPALVSGRVPVDGSGVVQPVSASALPLPSGAATAANQATANTSLSDIDTHIQSLDAKSPALGQAVASASVPVVLPASQITALTPPTSVAVNNFPASQAVTGTFFQATQPVSATSLPLPTGAATAANQATMIAQFPATLGAKTSAASLAVVLASDQASIATKQGASAIANAPVLNTYSTTAVTTTAYTQLIASTTAAAGTVDIFDSSGQAMILAVGAAGSEVIQYYVQPGGNVFRLAIAAGSRVSIKALTANATSGYITLNLLQ